MTGRGFLPAARRLAAATTEGDWRGAVTLAYYALFLECRAALHRWGKPVGRQANVHRAVRVAFENAAAQDLKDIADVLDRWGRARTKACYVETPTPPFLPVDAVRAVQDVTDAIALLDALEADPVRRAAAIASLPP